MSHKFRLAIVPVYLLLCVLLGGASAAGHWANMLLQLIAVVLIFWSLGARRSMPLARPERQLMALAVTMILLVLLQLVPLPPDIWLSLGGRERIADGFRLLGKPLPWLPISLAPYKSFASLLWLLPALGVLFGMIRLGAFKATWIAAAFAAGTLLAVLIGALQVAGGEMSPWYFYEISNRGVMTGFFSNANHMATFLVITIPFLTALFAKARRKARSAQSSSGVFVILIGGLAVVSVGLVINQSLAGLGLALPVTAASFLMLRARRGKLPSWSILVVAALTVGSVALVFSAPFANNLTSEAAKSSPYSRYTTFGTSIRAAKDFFPTGSGIGSFVEIYPQYEEQADVTRWHMNHVHSDFIEIALEAGVLGIILVLLFLIWWSGRVLAIWRADQADYFARASTIASAAILAHSIVDYPLRTAAISAAFAVCCALMAGARAKVRQHAKSPAEDRARHLSAD